MPAFGVVMARIGGESTMDIEVPNRFVEAFLVHSWAEHLRQHERQTKADRELEQQVYSYVAGYPTVRHLLSANSIER